MIPTTLRDELLSLNGKSESWLTRQAQRLAAKFGPMETEEAKLILAHESGISLRKHGIPPEVEERVRMLRSGMQRQGPAVLRPSSRSATVHQAELEGRPPTPRMLFDERHFHASVAASRKLFSDGHYMESVRKAFQALHNRVKKLSNSSQSGQQLMQAVFSFDSQRLPVLQLNDLADQSQQDEQRGLQFLMVGATAAFRNVSSHDDEWRWDRAQDRALECLALASLLNHLVDECEAFASH